MTEVVLQGLHLLVIEDEVFMRVLIQRMLGELGISGASTAPNGRVALAGMEEMEEKVDLIICDLEMPVMGGLDFIQQLREGGAGERHKETAVVVLTGHSEEENLRRAVALGIQGYLVKPVSPSKLEKRIRLSVGAPIIDPSILSKKAD